MATDSAEDRAAGENLSSDSRRLSIDRHTSRTLELGQQVEEQQHGSKRGLCSKELLQAETIGTQTVLQLGNAIFHELSPGAPGPEYYLETISMASTFGPPITGTNWIETAPFAVTVHG